MSVTLKLFNGAKTKEAWNEDSPEFIDDWKPEERDITGLAHVQVTYGCHVKLMYEDGERREDFGFEDDLLVCDGVYYGDFMVVNGGDR